MKIRLSKTQRLDKESNMIKIVRVLRGGAKGFNEIQRATGFSSRTVDKHMSDLKNRGLVKHTAIGNKVVYSLTSKGIKFGGAWLLVSNLLELQDKGSSYLGSGGGINFLTNSEVKPLPAPALHDVSYPSNLQNYLNTTKIQHNAKTLLTREVINGLIKIDLDKISKDSKSIFAFEFDWNSYIKFARELKRFMSDIKDGTDFLADPELEFKDFQGYKLELLEAYLKNADLVEDQEYAKAFETLLKNENLASTLFPLGMWGFLLNEKVLDRVIRLFEMDKDPLDEKVLVKTLIVKVPKGGFYVPLYDYLIIARILNYKNKPFVQKLVEYEFKNKMQLDKSKVWKIQQEMYAKSGELS